jgi:hypothetical protein
VVAVSLMAWAWWPAAGHRYAPDPRDRQFSQFKACVLTDGNGIVGPDATPVWAGVIEASKVTGAQGTFLAVPDAGSEAVATQYVNTLAARGCGLVIAAGKDEVAAATVRATAYPRQQFVVVGVGRPASNVAVVAAGAPDDVRRTIAALVEHAARGESATVQPPVR